MISTKVQRRTLFAAVISAALLAACAQPQQPAAGPVKAITGTVDLRERSQLPAQAVLVVELQDTSRTDAAAQVVSQQIVKIEGLLPPFKFLLPVDPGKVNASAQYTVRARITNGKDPVFVSDTAYPVLTRGAGQTADLMLVRVAPN